MATLDGSRFLDCLEGKQTLSYTQRNKVMLGLGDNSKVISVLSKKQIRWDFGENSEMIFSCFCRKTYLMTPY